jgi:hypothetical protein
MAVVHMTGGDRAVGIFGDYPIVMWHMILKSYYAIECERWRGLTPNVMNLDCSQSMNVSLDLRLKNLKYR